jgi:hypothetical protein
VTCTLALAPKCTGECSRSPSPAAAGVPDHRGRDIENAWRTTILAHGRLGKRLGFEGARTFVGSINHGFESSESAAMLMQVTVTAGAHIDD